MGIIRVLTWPIGLLAFLLSPPDPPSGKLRNWRALELVSWAGTTHANQHIYHVYTYTYVSTHRCRNFALCTWVPIRNIEGGFGG